MRDDQIIYLSQNGAMAKQRWFLKEWRKHRGYSQQRLADMLETSKGYISDLENGNRPYNQDFLERLSDALMCTPADLIMRDPSQPDLIYSIWETLSPVERVQAAAVIKAIKGTGTNG